MTERSTGVDFLRYLGVHWKIPAAACLTALVIAGASSALFPKRYTATAAVLVEAPAGNDPRAVTAISPIYLESLKTYQLIASSDSLFLRALEDLHLRERFQGTSVEALKRQILDVSKPANTSIIEISATLNDPKESQSLAQYIAEHMIGLNSSLDRESSTELLQEPQRLYAAASARREAAEKAQSDFLKSTSVETLEKELDMARELKSEIGRDLARAKALLADYLGQLKAPLPLDPAARQAGWIEFQMAATRSRIEDLERQDSELLLYVNEKSPVLEKLKWAREIVEAELKAARGAEEAAKAKLGDMTTSAAFRGARLKILDPGIVPERPSFPNLPLNLAAAFLLSLAASIVYLALRFAHGRVQRPAAEPVYSAF